MAAVCVPNAAPASRAVRHEFPSDQQVPSYNSVIFLEGVGLSPTAIRAAV